MILSAAVKARSVFATPGYPPWRILLGGVRGSRDSIEVDIHRVRVSWWWSGGRRRGSPCIRLRPRRLLSQLARLFPRE
ncbi:hypothetical protein I7I48_10068 [Histoplasma ohiense]|nr:hypothetical protein I7I48_10068 [Histoplasma ohiense (nom. inval.)]